MSIELVPCKSVDLPSSHRVTCPFHLSMQRLSFAKGKSDAVVRLEAGTKKSKKEKKKAAAETAVSAVNGLEGGAEPRSGHPAPPRTAEDAGEPNATLFVENLPEATTSDMLSMLFSQYAGR